MANVQCQSCHIGELKETKQTYVTTFRGHAVVDPRVPALRCDMCGAQYQDQDHVVWIEETVRAGQ